MTPSKKMGLAISGLVLVTAAIAVWNFYVAFVLLPLLFGAALFAAIALIIVRSRRSDR